MIFLRMIQFFSILTIMMSLWKRMISFEGISLDSSLRDTIMVNNDIILDNDDMGWLRSVGSIK